MIHGNLKRRLSYIVKRYLVFKEKRDKSHLGMMHEILIRTLKMFWIESRRFFIILNQNYDFYGWKKRSTELVYRDLLEGSKADKVSFLETFINFDEISNFIELGSNSVPILFGLARK
jgi:hypothetical protein